MTIFDEAIAEAREVLCVCRVSMSPEEIARALGIPLETLEKYYGPEMMYGREVAKAAVLSNLSRQAKNGSTAAAKMLFDLAQNGAPVTPPKIKPIAPRRYPLGKKEIADAQALEIPDGWRELLN
jgi:hypothetical protein